MHPDGTVCAPFDFRGQVEEILETNSRQTRGEFVAFLERVSGHVITLAVFAVLPYNKRGNGARRRKFNIQRQK
jgi:hypothetical protein